MTLNEMIYQCQRGKLGRYPKHDGFFKWNYGTRCLDFKNSKGDQFLANQLQSWNDIKDTHNFYYII